MRRICKRQMELKFSENDSVSSRWFWHWGIVVKMRLHEVSRSWLANLWCLAENITWNQAPNRQATVTGYSLWGRTRKNSVKTRIQQAKVSWDGGQKITSNRGPDRLISTAFDGVEIRIQRVSALRKVAGKIDQNYIWTEIIYLFKLFQLWMRNWGLTKWPISVVVDWRNYVK